MALLCSGAGMCSDGGLECERRLPRTVKCLSLASMKLASFGNSQWNLFMCCMNFLLIKNFSTFLLSPSLLS